MPETTTLIFVFQKTGESVTEAIADVPVDVNQTFADGVCGGTSQTIALHFFDAWKLTLKFGRNETDDEYHMTYVSLSYSFKPGHPPFSDAAAYANMSGLCFFFHSNCIRVHWLHWFHRDGSYTVTSGGENFAVRDVSVSEVDKKTILSFDVGGRVTRSNAVLDQDVFHYTYTHVHMCPLVTNLSTQIG